MRRIKPCQSDNTFKADVVPDVLCLIWATFWHALTIYSLWFATFSICTILWYHVGSRVLVRALLSLSTGSDARCISWLVELQLHWLWLQASQLTDDCNRYLSANAQFARNPRAGVLCVRLPVARGVIVGHWVLKLSRV